MVDCMLQGQVVNKMSTQSQMFTGKTRQSFELLWQKRDILQRDQRWNDIRVDVFVFTCRHFMVVLCAMSLNNISEWLLTFIYYSE